MRTCSMHKITIYNDYTTPYRQLSTHLRRLTLYHKVNFWNVQSPSSHISCYQTPEFSFSKTLKRNNNQANYIGKSPKHTHTHVVRVDRCTQATKAKYIQFTISQSNNTIQYLLSMLSLFVSVVYRHVRLDSPGYTPHHNHTVR